MACYRNGDFFRYFKENMNDLGLPVPEGVFDTYTMATANLSLLIAALHTLGKGATMAEVAGATLGFEKLMVAGAVGATYYTGAAVGSVAVATGRSLGCGSRISDLFVLIERESLQFPGWHLFYRTNPGIIEPEHPSRRVLAVRGRYHPNSFEYLA